MYHINNNVFSCVLKVVRLQSEWASYSTQFLQTGYAIVGGTYNRPYSVPTVKHLVVHERYVRRIQKRRTRRSLSPDIGCRGRW